MTERLGTAQSRQDLDLSRQRVNGVGREGVEETGVQRKVSISSLHSCAGSDAGARGSPGENQSPLGSREPGLLTQYEFLSLEDFSKLYPMK